jgi:hypothetical protein
MVLQELDRQASDLGRIARGIDSASGFDSPVELEVGQLLQLSPGRAEWLKEIPLLWLDVRIKTSTHISRTSTHSSL